MHLNFRSDMREDRLNQYSLLPSLSSQLTGLNGLRRKSSRNCLVACELDRPARTLKTDLDNQRVIWIEKLGFVRFQPKRCLIEKQNLAVLDSDSHLTIQPNLRHR